MANGQKIVRRIVTMQPPGAPSQVFSDAAVPNVHDLGPKGPVLMEIWKTNATPSTLRWDDEEPAEGAVQLSPPKGGHLFRIVDIPPDAQDKSDAQSARELFAKMGEADAATHGEHDGQQGGLMHRTASLDYGIVLEGEIVLVLDSQEVVVHTGDVVVQRGTNHGWSNRSGRNCRMAFFMVDAEYSK